MRFNSTFLEGLVIVFSILQDFGKAYGTTLLFRFDPKSYIGKAWVVAFICSYSDTIWMDYMKIPYGYSMIITFFIAIIAFWKVYNVKFSYGMLLGITYALMQSIMQRSISAIWRSLINPNADFVNNFPNVSFTMLWCFIATPIIFGLLYIKGMGFHLMQEQLYISKVHDRRILIFSFIYATFYSLRSIYLPKSIWIVFAEPAFALMVLWVIQYKIKKDWDEHYQKINAKDLHL